MKRPTPGIYRRTPAGGLEPVVQATFVTVWRGARGENVPQYAVERVDNNGTAIAWVYSIKDGEYLCRLLNGGLPEIRERK
jgi:hypothetical protein